MNPILHENYREKWCAIPKELITQYSKVIGTTGIALYVFLAANADSDCVTALSPEAIAKTLSLKLTTVQKTLAQLATYKLIQVNNTPSYFIQLLWRPLPRPDFYDVKTSKKSKPLYSNESPDDLKTIKTSERFHYEINSHLHRLKSFMHTPQHIQLAHEIADTLHDPDALPLYLSYTQRYPEEVLRNILTKVLSIPDAKIRKTRGALFTYLVTQYAEHQHDVRD